MAEGFETAKLVVHKEDKKGDVPSEVSFSFNPEAVRVTKTLKPREQRQAGQDSAHLQFTGGDSLKLEFGEILFDTFEDRKSVYSTHIQDLEKLIHANAELHRIPRVLFVWGQGFGSEGGRINTGTWYITALDVNYIMFLPNGTPVRAKCKLTLTEVPDDNPSKSVKSSPDTAHVHLVSRGDSLQAIAFNEYDDPAQWRRIAEANGIDDPLSLSPGRRLLIPPILK
ncbi:MAG: LysM peptidoglycan-binding domain-containing protein [Myxococcales bacterium]|nr:LysM peptidoglycan-binding domain-containing protein [Myxococcales bacterium]